MNKFQCNVCNKDFKTEESLKQHTFAVHSKDNEEYPNKNFKIVWYVVIIASVMLVSIYFLTSNLGSISEHTHSEDIPEHSHSEESYTSSSSEDIPNYAIHWHLDLAIFIDNQKQIIPANIGLGAVHQAVHTHGADGTIHIENKFPTEDNMKLGFFFKLWKKTFNSTCIFEYCGNVTMTVNGVPNYDYDNYFMKNDDKIIISYVS